MDFEPQLDDDFEEEYENWGEGECVEEPCDDDDYHGDDNGGDGDDVEDFHHAHNDEL